MVRTSELILKQAHRSRRSERNRTAFSPSSEDSVRMISLANYLIVNLFSTSSTSNTFVLPVSIVLPIPHSKNGSYFRINHVIIYRHSARTHPRRLPQGLGALRRKSYDLDLLRRRRPTNTASFTADPCPKQSRDRVHSARDRTGCEQPSRMASDSGNGYLVAS